MRKLSDSPSETSRLAEIARVFGRLGCLGFGGPLAVMAMMEEETSRKRGWLSGDQFTEVYALCKVLPGPVATQMAIYLGYIRGGTLGGILSGSLFILPSFLLVLLLSYVYMTSGAVQKAGPAFAGMQAAALVVIIASTLLLARPFRNSSQAWVIGIISAAIIWYAPRTEPLVILFFGIVGILLASSRQTRTRAPVPPKKLGPGKSANSFFPALGSVSLALHSQLGQLFWVCFKAGAFVFGTGLAIVPLLEGDTVGKHHWLTHAEFMDGLAMGQITPGPVTITSTFIGYKTAGLAGAFVATIGMFLPAFINVLVFVPRLWRRFSGTAQAKGFSTWAIPAVIGGILGTTVRLGESVLSTTLPLAIFIAAGAVTFFFRPAAWLLIPASGIVAAAAGYFL